MAKFDGEGEISIYITPQEFMQNCSAGELIRLSSLCEDYFGLVPSDAKPEEKEVFEETPRSFSQIKFNQALITLKSAWFSLSKIDGDIIEDIAKKYE